MIAFDTDIFSLFLVGHSSLSSRVMSLPRGQLVLPVVVVEEVMRGRLNKIRQTQRTGQQPLSLAYDRLAYSVKACQHYGILAYTMEADGLYQEWRAQRIRLSTQDMRIGAICVSQKVTLITRNQRDFEKLPGLSLELWI